MNIALEHNMVGLIVSAVFDWADGKYSKVRFICCFNFIEFCSYIQYMDMIQL